MAKIRFAYNWLDDNKTIFRFQAEDDWNWKDYHAVAHAAQFAFYSHDENTVDTVIDLRGTNRTTMPSGLAVHARTFGKRLSPAMTGRAIVLGVPQADRDKLNLIDSTLKTQDGEAVFVDTDDEVLAVLEQWRG
jgi:hypothetical protein